MSKKRPEVDKILKAFSETHPEAAPLYKVYSEGNPADFVDVCEVWWKSFQNLFDIPEQCNPIAEKAFSTAYMWGRMDERLFKATGEEEFKL